MLPLPLSLTFDHRFDHGAVNCGEAARFLAVFKSVVEQPLINRNVILA